jgi:GT2 family glycosyltransferase
VSGIAKVSVAILSWNGLEHLKICLPALAAQRDPGVEWELLLLDNGSRDGTAAWVREHHPRVRLIESAVNLGFCRGVNQLVSEADGDAVALLNNDTRPVTSWLVALVDALAAAPSDVAAVSGQIVDWEGERLDFARGAMTFDGHAFQLDYRRKLSEVRLPADGEELLFACGGNMIVRRASFLAAGGFDDDYFAYLEDVDLGWRLWAGGERILFSREARVHHRSGATSELLGLFNRGFLFERNAFLTAYKNYEAGWWERMMPAVQLTLTARTQALLERNNPGGAGFRIDPYAGLIADTSGGPPAGAATPATPPDVGLSAKWRGYGPRDFFRRALVKAVNLAFGAPTGAGAAVPAKPGEAEITDPRTVAQLRATSYLLSHLDAAAVKRRQVQARRRRGDREIFERFPLYLVPTYPGDEELFASDAFAAWLPDDLPLVRRELGEVMSLDP